jgi:hypothetical protein
MPMKSSHSRDPACGTGEVFLFIALVSVQLYISVADNLLGPYISLDALMFLPLVASALFLRRHYIFLLSVLSATLMSYSHLISLGYQPTFRTFALNFLVSAFSFGFVGDFFWKLLNSRPSPDQRSPKRAK